MKPVDLFKNFGDLLIVTTAAQSQIEEQFSLLPPEDQHALLRRLRERLAPSPADWAADIEAMARDPDIQREIRNIEREFSVTENDGLKET